MWDTSRLAWESLVGVNKSLCDVNKKNCSGQVFVGPNYSVNGCRITRYESLQ